MIDTDRQDFYITWASAWESCGKSVTDRMLKFTFECLKHFDLQDIQRAVIMHSQDPDHGSFAPKPADIIRQIEGGGDERSLKAWTKVNDAIVGVGSWNMLVFDDCRIHAVVDDMGGWRRFCEVTIKDLPFLRNEFTKRYRGYLQHKPTRYSAMLRGEGGFNQPPMLIGDKQLAQMVMLGGSSGAFPTEISELSHDALQALPAPNAKNQ